MTRARRVRTTKTTKPRYEADSLSEDDADIEKGDEYAPDFHAVTAAAADKTLTEEDALSDEELKVVKNRRVRSRTRNRAGQG